MQKQVESDGKADETIYNKFSCWCSQNTKEKSEAIKTSERTVKVVQGRVEELLTRSQSLKAESEKLEDEIAAKQASLEKSNALRKQQLKEYVSDKQRLTGDIGSVDAGITQLGTDETATGFLQKQKVAALQTNLRKLLEHQSSRISHMDRENIEAFLQEPTTDAGGIVGTLTGIKDSMSDDLKQLEEQEVTHKKDSEALTGAIIDEIKASSTQLDNKRMEKADADEEHAHKKLSIKDTRETVTSDKEFLADVEKRCADVDSQWDERSKTRADELEAISKAIATLNADEAHDTFYKSFGKSFVQVSDTSGQERRELAAETLEKAGKRDARLLALAQQAKIDGFIKVKKAMDDMAVALKKEQKNEVDQKEYCVKSLQTNKVQTEDKTGAKDRLVAKEGSLGASLSETEEDVSSLNGEVAELQKQLKIAGQNREAENKEFQKVVPEQQEAQRLLKQALEVLGKFYNKQGSLVEVHAHGSSETKSAPAGFKDYQSNSKSFGVMSMIQQLIADCKTTEAEAAREEASAQKAYEAFAKDTSVSVEKKKTALAEKRGEKAKLEKTKVQTRQTKEGVESELENLGQTKAQLHGSCDWLVSNFEARQAARSDEIDSVAKAKAILSGANFAEIQLS